jgi:hypothetical protein
VSPDTAALRALLDSATPGPWEVYHGYSGAQNIAQMRSTDRTVSVAAEKVISTKRGDVPPWERTMPNAQLIVAAVNALPELLDEIDRLRDSHKMTAALLEDALARSGDHHVIGNGYCLDCQGGCMRGFGNPDPDVALVEPSPFSVREARRG